MLGIDLSQISEIGAQVRDTLAWGRQALEAVLANQIALHNQIKEVERTLSKVAEKLEEISNGH